MLARAILILSCLLCTHGYAQAQAASTTDTTTPAATPAQVSGESIQSAVPVHREALAPAPEPAPKQPLENDPLFTPAVVLIGGGGAALLASLFVGMGAHGIYTSLEKDCKNNICSSDKEQRISSGKALATVSTVLTGIGIAAAGVGTALLIIAAMNDDQPPKANFGLAKLRLTPGPSPLGVGAAASF